jgi:ribosomal protein S27AE
MAIKKNSPQPQNVEHKIEENSYFFSLIQPNTEKKKRGCLKCGVVFLSANYGNRVCGSCAAQNNRASIRAGEFF